MAKSMARIENGIVVNIEWCSDKVLESEIFKNIDDYPVAIGDTYENNKFYRNGELLLTPLEESNAKLSDLNVSYNEGVNSI